MTDEEIRALLALAERADLPWTHKMGGYVITQLGGFVVDASMSEPQKVALITACRHIPTLCAELLAERERRRKAQSYAYIGKDGKTVQARDLEDERDALRARVESLEQALEPFAELAARYDPPEADDDVLVWGDGAPNYGDLRRARAVLEGGK